VYWGELVGELCSVGGGSADEVDVLDVLGGWWGNGVEVLVLVLMWSPSSGGYC
jgi:hypothetical protein